LVFAQVGLDYNPSILCFSAVGHLNRRYAPPHSAFRPVK
jgi:hypothetical protein